VAQEHQFSVMSEPALPSLPRRSALTPYPLRLAGPLDLSAVEHVRLMLGRLGADTTHVILRCEAVSAVDPAAAACLWSLCRDGERRGTGRIQLEGLPSRFINRLRLHPLLDYVLAEDELFGDPFGQAAPSAR
jgi:ABC-type transporter Mla MlaB component